MLLRLSTPRQPQPITLLQVSLPTPQHSLSDPVHPSFPAPPHRTLAPGPPEEALGEWGVTPLPGHHGNQGKGRRVGMWGQKSMYRCWSMHWQLCVQLCVCSFVWACMSRSICTRLCVSAVSDCIVMSHCLCPCATFVLPAVARVFLHIFRGLLRLRHSLTSWPTSMEARRGQGPRAGRARARWEWGGADKSSSRGWP